MTHQPQDPLQQAVHHLARGDTGGSEEAPQQARERLSEILASGLTECLGTASSSTA